MTILAYLTLLGWIPAVLLMFALLPHRLAAATAVIGAWLILPPYSFPIIGLPDYSKTTAASLGVALGTLIFCPDRILLFRPRWFDLPMVLWCLSGIASSLQNGLGLYDGLADTMASIIIWGLPYLIGRLHFGDPESLRDFTVAMTIGGLCYILPCVWEMRMSPVLLGKIYGYGGGGGAFVKNVRLGGYRPQVFFATGLELGLWMMAASLTGWWLWRCGALKKVGQISFGPVLLPILLGTAILCRSTGAVLLLAMGMIILWLSVHFQTRLLLASLLLVGPTYVGVRASNLWSGQHAVAAASIISSDRAASLKYRLDCEDLLITKAVQKPVFGWGGWGRSYAYFNEGTSAERPVTTDGLWIIYLGSKGSVGLALFYLFITLPAIRFLRQFPMRLWDDPRLAAAAPSAVLLGLYIIDCLLNAFPNMIYITLAGGLMGLEPRQLRTMSPWRGGETADQTGVTPAVDIHETTLAADRNHTLGRTFKAEGRLKEAEAAWSTTLDLVGMLIAAHPDDPALRRWWCDCANDLAWLKLHHREPLSGDLPGAITLARHVVDMCPDGATYWNTLGTAYFRAGDDALAITALDEATALGGGTAFDNVFLAMAHARLGNRERAEHLLAQAFLQMEQDNPGHPELVRFCDEARSILVDRSGATATAHSTGQA